MRRAETICTNKRLITRKPKKRLKDNIAIIIRVINMTKVNQSLEKNKKSGDVVGSLAYFFVHLSLYIIARLK